MARSQGKLTGGFTGHERHVAVARLDHTQALGHPADI